MEAKFKALISIVLPVLIYCRFVSMSTFVGYKRVSEASAFIRALARQGVVGDQPQNIHIDCLFTQLCPVLFLHFIKIIFSGQLLPNSS